MVPSIKSTETTASEIRRIEIIYQSPFSESGTETEVINVEPAEALSAPFDAIDGFNLSVEVPVEQVKTTGLQP